MNNIRVALTRSVSVLFVLLAACSQVPAPQADDPTLEGQADHLTLMSQVVTTIRDVDSCRAAGGSSSLGVCRFERYTINPGDTLEVSWLADTRTMVDFGEIVNNGTFKSRSSSLHVGRLENNGAAEVNGSLQITGSFYNRGTITINKGDLRVESLTSNINSGTIKVNSGGKVSIASGSNLRNTGTISLVCGSTLSVRGSLSGNPPLSDCPNPSVRLEQAAGQADPTASSSISFTATFSKAVRGFEATDVSLRGTAGATRTTITEITPNDGTTFKVTVSGMTTGGSVIVSLAAGVVTDTAGNPNIASTSADNLVTYDATPPSVTINPHASQPLLTRSNPVRFTVQFSEPVSGFTAADVRLRSDFLANISGASISVAGGPSTYEVTVSGIRGFGGIHATVVAGAAKDRAGNDNTVSTSTNHVVVDLP